MQWNRLLQFILKSKGKKKQQEQKYLHIKFLYIFTHKKCIYI